MYIEVFYMKNILMIMNPNSGTKKANKVLTDILILFNQYGYLTNVCMTSKNGDAEEYVKHHHHNSDLIVCVGGDGTLNQVVSAMVETECKIPLGYIPTGSTNDFATGMKINKNVLDAARDIMTGNVKYIDVGNGWLDMMKLPNGQYMELTHSNYLNKNWYDPEVRKWFTTI